MIPLAVAVMGVSGITAEVVLLREFLISFQGNELSIGIVLANWLLLEAAGALAFARRADRARDPVGGFVLLGLLFALSFPTAICLVRSWQALVGIAPGEGVGLLPMAISSLLIQAPVSITHGGLFPYGCRLLALKGQGAEAAGRAYMYETVGTIVGGLVFTYLLITRLSSLEMASVVAALNLALGALLVRARKRALFGVSLGLLVAVGVSFPSGLMEGLRRASVGLQWRGQEVLFYRNSIYGNIVVAKLGRQLTFFSDRTPVITVPHPDIVFAEEFAHLPLLHHPRPLRVALIGSGAGGLISELLKHPLEEVYYVELDPLLIEALRKFPTPLTQRELGDPRVRTFHLDGRLFLKEAPAGIYDLVLVGVGEPQDLQSNRLFTREFFALAKEKLREGGILALTLPGSLSHIPKELRDLNLCIINTLQGVFPHIKVIPGDGYNILLASTSRLDGLDPQELYRRLRGRCVQTELLSLPYLRYRLHPRWQQWFWESLRGGTPRTNHDFRPLGVFYSIAHWTALFSPEMKGVFRALEGARAGHWLLALGAVGLLLVLGGWRKGALKVGVFWAIGSTGFCGMVLALALLYAFQSLWGYVFHWVGLLSTAFMVGVALGAKASNSFRVSPKGARWSFLGSDLVVLATVGLVAVGVLELGPLLEAGGVLKVVFLGLSLLCGASVGAEFPLANRVLLEPLGELGRTAGSLYALDLLGGWLGGIMGGVFLLPVLGVGGACLGAAILKGMSSAWLILAIRRAHPFTASSASPPTP